MPRATPPCVEVCHSLIYHAKKGDTPYLPYCRVNEQTAQSDTTDISSTAIFSQSSLIEVEWKTIHSVSVTLIRDPVSAELTGVFSAAEVKALQTLIRLAANAAE